MVFLKVICWAIINKNSIWFKQTNKHLIIIVYCLILNISHEILHLKKIFDKWYISWKLICFRRSFLPIRFRLFLGVSLKQISWQFILKISCNRYMYTSIIWSCLFQNVLKIFCEYYTMITATNPFLNRNSNVCHISDNTPKNWIIFIVHRPF